jgi:hypothetical protein
MMYLLQCPGTRLRFLHNDVLVLRIKVLSMLIVHVASRAPVEKHLKLLANSLRAQRAGKVAVQNNLYLPS